MMRGQTVLVTVAALAIGAAYIAFQYFVVFLGMIGYDPDLDEPVTTSDRFSCFRALMFVGPRNACAEGFVGGNRENGAATLNVLGGVVAGAGVGALGRVHQFRRLSTEHLVGFGVAALLTVVLLGWTLVSTFGFLLAPALSA